MNFFRPEEIKPSFMIIGVQKGGTSSLYYYLSQHPQIIAPDQKELHYFDTMEQTPAKPYLNMFPKSYFTRKLSFDATPRYIYYPLAAKNIYEFDPKMKFIVIFRDPVERAFSAWNMYKQMQNIEKWQIQFREREKRDNKERLHSLFYMDKFPKFEEWVNYELSDAFDDSIIEPSVVRRGYYKTQIEEYFKYFKKDSFLFLDFDCFKNNIKRSLKEVTEFLDLSEFDYSKINLKSKNARDYSDKMSIDVQDKLRNHYFIKNKGLQDLIGVELKWLNK